MYFMNKNSHTNWNLLKYLSESEIVAKAKEDKDNPLLSDKELQRFIPLNNSLEDKSLIERRYFRSNERDARS